MIRYTQNKGSKATAASTAETITFTSGDVLGTGVKAYHMNMTGTAGDLDSLTTLVVKAAGQNIWSVNETAHRAFIQSMAPSNFDEANGDTRATIPLYFVDRPKSDPTKFNCGFPNGQAPTLEISKDNTQSGAGTMFMGYTWDDDPAKLPAWYPMFIAQDTNAGASAADAWTPISQKGYVAGFSVLTTELTSFRLQLNGKDVVDLNVAQLLEAQQLGNTDVVTSPIFFRLDEQVQNGGLSGHYITGTASWLATMQVGIYSYVPQGQ